MVFTVKLIMTVIIITIVDKLQKSTEVNEELSRKWQSNAAACYTQWILHPADRTPFPPPKKKIQDSLKLPNLHSGRCILVQKAIILDTQRIIRKLLAG
jgi:hypothetical protein